MGSVPSKLRRGKQNATRAVQAFQNNRQLPQSSQAEASQNDGIRRKEKENEDAEEQYTRKKEAERKEEEEEEDDEEEQEEEEEEKEEEEEEEEEKEEKEEENNEEEEKETKEEEDGIENDEDEEEYETWDGKIVKIEYVGLKLHALRGLINVSYPEKTQIVRIFTSSTFTDTSVERNTLMEKIYPKIKVFCQKKGYEFQVVDMRWGVRDEATDDHMTTELCMKEIYACQKVSTGPNFITFLGQKYGYRPFPAKINKDEFTKLVGAVTKAEEQETLEKWFKLDDNAVPKEYVLQPVTSLLPNYRNQSNVDLKKAASNEWWSAFEQMQGSLRQAALKVLDTNNQQKYLMSVTEDEIRRGIITANSPEKHCFWFKRVIKDLNEHISEQKAGSFIDKVWGKPGVDEEAQRLLNTLRENVLPKALVKDNIKMYDVNWSDKGVDPIAEKAHDTYIKTLCRDFYAVLTKMIQDGITEKQKEQKDDEPIFDEIYQHALFCQKKCSTFHGREDFLKEIQNDIENDATTIVLHGASGSGKTSVLAKIASSITKWLGATKATVVLRFIGTTSESSAIRDLLRSICLQLCKATGHKTEIPEDLKSLKDHLVTCLELAAEKYPVVLMLDSLDQLSADDGGLQLEWLPRTLPSNVYMIVSTLPEDKYICLPKLKSMFPSECFKAVPKMSKDEADGILDKWLEIAKRTLTREQRQIVLDSFNNCPLPLFLKLAFDEALRWKSFTPKKESQISSSIRDIIHSLLDRLEKFHGKMLVSRSLAYISGSKNGLSESELEDILSLDDDVLNDVYQYWTPPVRRLPPLLWLRVRADLGDYLVERGSDGARVSFWYHRQFIEVSRERYLTDDLLLKIHSNMAEYFSGVWSDGRKKSFVNKEGKRLEMDRLVAQQPLMYDNNEDNIVYNKRKLAELPFHLAKSNQLQVLKETALCNFEFLLAKLCAMSHNLVMDDYRMAITMFPDDEELSLMSDTFDLCTNALKIQPRQLASQLIGRLFNMINDEKTVEQYPSISILFEQLRQSSSPYFVPYSKCLTSSGGPLLHAIAEHDESMIDSISLSSDNTTFITTVRGDEGLEIRKFNTRGGRLERKVIVTEPVPDIYLVWHSMLSSVDKNKLVLLGGRNILVFDLNKGEMIRSIEALSEDLSFTQGYDGIPVAFANNDRSIVAMTDKGVKIWNIESGKLEQQIPMKNIDANVTMGALDANNKYVAFAKHLSKNVQIVDIKTGKTMKTLDSVVKGKVKFLRITKKGQLFVMADSLTELKVYDVTSGDLVKQVQGFNANASVKKLLITHDETKLLCQDKFDLVIWDLKTWKCVKVLTDMSHVHSPNIESSDGRIVVHANIQDRIVRVYDTSKADKKEKDISTPADQWSVSQINAIAQGMDGRHFVVMATANSTSQITIWDTQQGKIVRAFRNIMFYPTVLRMMSPTIGVGFIYNEKMHHYAVLDLKEGKFLRYLEGKACKRMYMMDFLDHNKMMSFSRGRRNLKIWNVDNGKVVDQIKFGQKHRFEAFLLSGDKKIVVLAQAGSNSELKDDTVPFIVYNLSSKKHRKIVDEGKQLKLESTGLALNACISNNGRYLVNVMEYTTATLWDLEQGKKKHILGSDPPTGAVYGVTISERKNLVLTAFTGSEHGVHIWDIVSGDCIKKITTSISVNDVQFSNNENMVFFKDQTGCSFYVHDLNSGSHIASFTTDVPITPTAYTVINDKVVIGSSSTVNPVIFSLRQPKEQVGEENKQQQKSNPSIFETGDQKSDKFDFSPNDAPPNYRHDVDDDKDDDDTQPR